MNPNFDLLLTFENLSYKKIESKPKNKVPKILIPKLFVKIDLNNIKGICETSAKTNNLKRYFLKFLVCTYPSEIWNAKIGNAILPITLNNVVWLKKATLVWSTNIVNIAIHFKAKLVIIKIHPFYMNILYMKFLEKYINYFKNVNYMIIL